MAGNHNRKLPASHPREGSPVLKIEDLPSADPDPQNYAKVTDEDIKARQRAYFARFGLSPKE